MKLSTVTAKLTCMKSGAVRVLAAATLAGAVLTAAAPAAQAQHFGVGIRVGGPYYYAPAPRPRFFGPAYGYGYGGGFYDHGFYGPRRYEGFREHEAFVRHEEWDHHNGYGYRR